MAPVRWGIVTAGKICNDFVNAINSYPEKGDMVIVGIAARDKIKAAAFAKLHNIPQVFDTYEALAASDAIDVAYIGSLNPSHYEHIKLFLENGKHVLCEKPLCLNYKQVKTVVELARKKNLFLMEAVWSRFAPAYKALEQDIRDGKLGDVKFVEVDFGVPIESVDRVRQKELGGSAILDLGIYVLQFAQFIFKEKPKKVTAIGELNSDGVDVLETIVLEYGDSKRAVLNVHTKLRLLNNATVVGTKGHATLADPFHFPTDLQYSDGIKLSFPLHTSPLPYVFQNSAGLVFEALEASRCIKEGLIESPRMAHSESLILAELEDTIRQQIGVHFTADD